MIPVIGLLVVILSPSLARQSPGRPVSARPAGGAISTPGSVREPVAAAGIRGVAVTSQGTAVSGASVVVKNLQTGVETTSRTDSKGGFVFSGLPQGRYRLTTSAPGFVPDERQVELSPGLSPLMRIELKDGALRTLMPSVALPTVPHGSPPEQTLLEIRKKTGKPIDSEIDKQLESLKDGQIVFNPPKQMQAGTDETVTVRISKSLITDLAKGLLGSGDPQTQTIKVGSEMGVTLTGPQDYFTINRLNSDEKQIITGNDTTQWLFDILPLKAGHASMILTAYVVLDTPEGPEQHDYPVFAREIEIVTAPKPFVPAVLGFVADNWDKLLAAIVSTGLLGWIAARFKRRRGNAENKRGRQDKTGSAHVKHSPGQGTSRNRKH